MKRCSNASILFGLVALAALASAACSGPFVVFPGGRLDGDERPVPSDWSFAGDYGTCQLETNPADPYSVNIAYTIFDGSVYINAGDTETQWVKNMAADPSVRLQIDGILYAMRAERVSDPGEVARFGEAWTAQSMFRRDPAELDPVYVYRLVAR